MALPKEIIDAVKADKKMLAKKFDELKATLTEVLKPKGVDVDSNKDIVDAVNNVAATVKENNDSVSPKEMTAFDSIIAQGEMAEVDLQIKAEVKELQKYLNATSKSTSKEQKEAIEEQIALLKGDKLQSIEDKREALKIAKEGNAALKGIEEGQSSLSKSFKEGFDSMRGEGAGGLVRMLLIGIPALIGGIIFGIGAQIASVLSRFKSVALVFSKIGEYMAPLMNALATGGGAISGFLTKLPMVGSFFANLISYGTAMASLGAKISRFLGPIGIAIQVVMGIIGGIRGAMKGFKEDGIIGMLREGIIGVFNALIGGLVKMVGSMIGGIFKLLGFKKIGEGIKSGFADFVDGFVQFFRGAFNMIAGLFTLDMDRIKKGIGQALDGIVKFVFGAIKGIGGIIVGLLAGIVKGVIGAVKLALKAIFAYLKFVYITLPIALIKFIGKALKFIFWDLPIAAFGMVFDAVKFMFVGLPVMLIDKVKSFFTSMVESIGAAFTGALDFVKLIGKASWAALKAAMPGGESPKEAFLRVMGGAKDKEEEEKENAAVIKDKVDAKAVEPVEAIMPPSQPKKKETTEEFEARMMSSVSGKAPEDKMEKFNKIKEKWKDPLGFKAQTEKIKELKAKRSEGEEGAPAAEGEEGSGGIGDKIKAIGTMMLGIVMLPFTMLQKIQSTIIDVVKAVIDGVMGLVGTILGFIGKLGKAGIAAVKAIMPGGDSPAEAFMKVLSGDGEPKEEKIDGAKGMTPVLSSETPEEKPLSERDAMAQKYEDTFITGGASEIETVTSDNGVMNTDRVILTKEQAQEYYTVGRDMGLREQSEAQKAFRDNVRNTTDQEGLKRLMTDGAVAFNARVDDRNAAKKPESLKTEPEVEKKTDFMSMIFSRMKETASKAFGFTPKGLIKKGAGLAKDATSKVEDFGSKFFSNKSEEAGDLAVPTEPISRMSIKELMAKARENKEKSRAAARKFNEKRFGEDKRPTYIEERVQQMLAPIKPVTPTGGAEIAAGQNQVLDAKAEQAGTANVISTDQSVRTSTNNNSSSSVTIAAPAHIDKTPVVFGAPFRAW